MANVVQGASYHPGNRKIQHGNVGGVDRRRNQMARLTEPSQYNATSSFKIGPYLGVAEKMIPILNQCLGSHVEGFRLAEGEPEPLAALMLSGDVQLSRGMVAKTSGSIDGGPENQDKLLMLLKQNPDRLGVREEKREAFRTVLEEKRDVLWAAFLEEGVFQDLLSQKGTLHLVQRVRFHASQLAWWGDRLRVGLPHGWRTLQQVLKAGQGHLLEGWGELPPPIQASFLKQLKGIDFLAFREAFTAASYRLAAPPAHEYRIPDVRVTTQAEDAGAYEAGVKALQEEGLGIIFFAGGDSTRFVDEMLNTIEAVASRQAGVPSEQQQFVAALFAKHSALRKMSRADRERELFAKPGYTKHTFPITPDGRSVLDVAVDRVGALGRLAGCPVPACFVAGHNNQRMIAASVVAQRQRLQELGGLQADAAGTIGVVVQGKMPMTDTAGRILRRDSADIAFNPNGTGGALLAPKERGFFAQHPSVRYVIALNADDYQILTGDHLLKWLGRHVLSQQGLSMVAIPTPTQVIDGQEQVVGKFGKFFQDEAGNLHIIEYVEQTPEMRRQKGWVNINAYLMEMDLYNQLDPDNLWPHLSEPKPFSTAWGMEASRKLEWFATDLPELAPVQHRGIAISPSSQVESAPIKNFAAALALWVTREFFPSMQKYAGRGGMGTGSSSG